MKLVTVLLGILLLVNFGCVNKGSVLKTREDRYSYAIGMDLGKKQKKRSYELLNPDAVAKGMVDALTDSESLMTGQDHNDAIAEYEKDRKQVILAHKEEKRKLNEKIKKEGELFLTGNSANEGIITLPDGLQYKVIREGTGKTPKPDDTVIVNYRVTLIDGTEVDSSEHREKPVSYRVKFGIAGLKKALQLMKEGAKWQLYIPSNLAYGKRGDRRFKVPAYSPLLYEVELISIEEQADK